MPGARPETFKVVKNVFFDKLRGGVLKLNNQTSTSNKNVSSWLFFSSKTSSSRGLLASFAVFHPVSFSVLEKTPSSLFYVLTTSSMVQLWFNNTAFRPMACHTHDGFWSGSK